MDDTNSIFVFIKKEDNIDYLKSVSLKENW